MGAWAFATAWLLSIGLLAAEASGAEKSSLKLEIYPARVRLSGPEAAQRLVILGVDAQGAKRDLTVEAKIESRSPDRVRIGDDGSILPVADGTGEVVVRVGTSEARVPVEVAKATLPRTVSFRNEVVPLLTKLGCNQGACHGSQHGKGGFKLSLLGFEPEADYIAIVKSAEERRVTPFAPEESLLLLKPTLAVAHGGGKRMEVGSPAYRLLTLWLEEGRRDLATTIRASSALKVYPEHRLMEPGQEQHLVVVGHARAMGPSATSPRDARFDTLERRRGDGPALGAGQDDRQGRGQYHGPLPGPAAMARLTVPFAGRATVRVSRRQTSSTSRPPRSGASWGWFPSPALHRRRVPPPRHARHDRHHADARRGRGLSGRSTIPPSERSWSTACSIGRNTSISGR